MSPNEGEKFSFHLGFLLVYYNCNEVEKNLIILIIEIFVVAYYRKNIGKFGTLVMLNLGFVSVVTTGLQYIVKLGKEPGL